MYSVPVLQCVRFYVADVAVSAVRFSLRYLFDVLIQKFLADKRFATMFASNCFYFGVIL